MPPRPPVISGTQAHHQLLKITGDEALARSIRHFRDSSLRRVNAAVIRKSATETRKHVRKAAPHKSLRDGIGARTEKLSHPTKAMAKAGLNVGRRNKSAKPVSSRGKKTLRRAAAGAYTPHLHLFVLGTTDRVTRKGAKRGLVKPTDFIQQAALASRSQVHHVIIAEARKRIDKEVARARSRG